MSPHPLSARAKQAPQGVLADTVHAFAAFVAFLFVLLVWLPNREYGDGPRYVSMLSAYEFAPKSAVHWAYVPGAQAFRQALGAIGIDLLPGMALKAYSAFCVALGTTGSWTLARLVGASRPAAWFCTALALLSPVLAFYGRVAEVHAQHFAASAWFFVALVAIGKHGRLLTALVVLLGSPLLYLTHESGGVLFVGVAFFALFAVGQRYSLLAIAGWGMVAGIGLFLGILFAATMRGISPMEMLKGTTGLVIGDDRPLQLLRLWTDLVLPVSLVWPFILYEAVCGWRIRRRFIVASLALIGPPLAFFTWWAIPEHGAYTLGYLPILLALGGLGLTRIQSMVSRPAAVLAALGLLAVQGAVSGWLVWKYEASFNAQYQNDRFRAVATAVAPDEARIIITLDPTKQTPSALLNNTYEYRLLHPVLQAIRNRVAPAQVVTVLESAVGGIIGMAAEADATLYYDRSYWRIIDLYPELEPYAVAIEDAFEHFFEVEEKSGSAVWRLAPR